MKLRLDLTPKLALIFVLFAALVLAAGGIFAYTNARKALESATVAELFSAAIEKQAAINSWIEEAKTHATAIATSPYFQENAAALLAASASGDEAGRMTAHDHLVEELQVWTGDGRDFLAWTVLDAETGQVLAATEPTEEGKFREDQPYFLFGKDGPYVQNLYYSPSSQGTLLTVSAPIFNEDGNLLGVLAGNLDLNILNNIISRRTGLRQSDDVFLVNTSNLFVTQPRFIEDPAILLRGVYTEAITQCLQRNSGTITAEDYRGIPAMIVYRWLPERQLCLIVKMDQSEALAPVLRLRNNILLVSSLVLLAAVVLSYSLARTISQPVRQLLEATHEISAGNLNTRLNVSTGDEIERLTKEFEKMTKSLRSTQEKLIRQERLATLGEVAGSIGHELRNPLGVITNAIYFLKMSQPEANESIKEYLNIIEAEARTSEKIISDLLDFTRTKAVEHAPVAVAGLVQRTLERYPAPDSVEVFLKIPTDIPQILADPAQASQILGNLVINGFQAMRQEGNLTISAKAEENMVGIAVSDTGEGIPAENIKKLFEPLFTTKARGIGLGLAVCKKLVEANDGRIEVASEPGKGSTFTVYFPITKERI